MIKTLSPQTHVYILYRDIRTYGFKESYYTEARKQGVIFVRYEESSKPEVSQNGHGLKVCVVDQTLGLPIQISADLVALSAGIHPNEGNKEVAQFLKVPLNSEGFFLEAHMKLRPVDFMTDGVFLCGLAHSPKTIEESILQAQAAASRAATILAQDSIEMEANVSQVVDEACDGCAYCVDTCPFKAITLLEYMWQGTVKKVGAGGRDHLQGLRLLRSYLPEERHICPRIHPRPDRGPDPCGLGSGVMEDTFEPLIIALCCNWCSYAGADLAGVSRSQYPPSIRIVRVMCSGMVHPNLVIDALTKGADGVLMCGCHPGDCHYQEGNLKAEKRAEAIKLMLPDFGIEEERFRLEWVSAAEGARFAQVVKEFTEQVQKLGASPYKQ